MFELDRRLVAFGSQEARRRGISTVEVIWEYLQRNPSIKNLYLRRKGFEK